MTILSPKCRKKKMKWVVFERARADQIKSKTNLSEGGLKTLLLHAFSCNLVQTYPKLATRDIVPDKDNASTFQIPQKTMTAHYKFNMEIGDGRVLK